MMLMTWALLACAVQEVEPRPVRWTSSERVLHHALDRDESGFVEKQEVPARSTDSVLDDCDGDGDRRLDEQELAVCVNAWRVSSLTPKSPTPRAGRRGRRGPPEH